MKNKKINVEDIELLDKEGYPTEEILNYIKTYDLKQGIFLLLEILHKIWNYKDCCKIKIKRTITLELITCGWSGNEDIVQALMENKVFWFSYWEESKKGGYYKFKIKEKK